MFEIPEWNNKDHPIIIAIKSKLSHDESINPRPHIKKQLNEIIYILSNIEKYAKGLTKGDIALIKNCIGNINCHGILDTCINNGYFKVSVDGTKIKVYTEQYDYDVYKNDDLLMALDEVLEPEQEEKVNEGFIRCLNAIVMRFPLMVIESYKLHYAKSIIFPRLYFERNKGFEMDFRGCEYSGQRVQIRYEKGKYYISFGVSINTIELTYYDLKNKIINFDMFRIENNDLVFATNLIKFIKDNI